MVQNAGPAFSAQPTINLKTVFLFLFIFSFFSLSIDLIRKGPEVQFASHMIMLFEKITCRSVSAPGE